MLAVFLSSIGFIAFTYAGYPVYCYVRAKLRNRPIARSPIRPNVSVIIAAYRESGTIAKKLESLRQQSYPAALIEIIVACDGSDDGTPEVARNAGGDKVEVIALPENRGKPTALNAGVHRARGEILLFTDARQALSPQAIESLVEDLADENVGAAGGELVLQGGEPAGAYWKLEAWIRRLEGQAGSTVGVSGALYAMRRADFEPLPEETILDDVLVPMRLRLKGKRVVFEPAAQAFDRAAASGREFRRKVRTLSGNFQLLALCPALLLPWRNPSWFDFVAHKLFRLLVPYAMLLAFMSAVFLPAPYDIVFVAGQGLGYSLAGLRGLGFLRGSRVAGLCETLVVLNAAAVVGLLRFLRYGRRLPW